MPLVRVSRDKRGYEHTYLIQVPESGARTEQGRLLYWFRTPPGLKVGREPLDPAARRALESQYPDVTFDWRSLVATPPPVEQPNWRERRQAARAAKRVRTDEPVEETVDTAPAGSPREGGKNRRRNRRGRGRRPDVATASTESPSGPEPASEPESVPADNPPDPS